MKILMLNYEYPPLGGGAALVSYYILKELAKYNDIEVDLVTSSVDKERVEKINDRVTVYFLDIGKKNKNIHFQTIRDLLSYSTKAYAFCKRLIKEKRYDFCHAFFTVPCGYIASKLKLPFVVSLQGSDVPFYNKRFFLLDTLFFKKLSKKIWGKAHCVTSNSEGLTDLAHRIFPELDIKLIYNGVDLNEFEQKEYKLKDKITLISTGRLIKRKGYDYLIRALQGLDDFKLILIGTGNIKEELEALAKDLNVDVEFKGALPHSSIKEELTKADVFVLPSLNEGMSISLLEAISTGLPAIVTDVGGSKELVKDNGIVVEKGSVEKIKEALLVYQKDRSLIEKHGKLSRKIAEKMSWSEIVKLYIDIYKKCLI